MSDYLPADPMALRAPHRLQGANRLDPDAATEAAAVCRCGGDTAADWHAADCPYAPVRPRLDARRPDRKRAHL